MLTWARLTARSAVHILTWSPELGLTLLVAKLSWGSSCLLAPALVTALRPEQVSALAANMVSLKITLNIRDI